MSGYKRVSFILVLIVGIAILFAQCMNRKPPATETTFAGEQACRQCHSTIYDSYQQNAHKHTSQGADDKLLEQLTNSFTAYKFNDSISVKIEKRDDRYWQVTYLKGTESQAKPIDIVVGSGEKAFTFGYWESNMLKQLPLSYFATVASWANSPGFPKEIPKYDRIMGARCLQCHSSFVEYTSKTAGLSVTEELKEGSIVFGLDCERCHGPAGKHVEFQQANPEVKQSKFMCSYKTFSRTQQLDACGVCHSGNDMLVHKSAFSFLPGDDLKDFYAYDAGRAGGDPDVHGNQQMMLQQSACFIKSKEMDCGSCHKVHENIKGNLAIYSKRCISCHETQKHSRQSLKGTMAVNNCIDCHMPKQSSRLISFQLASKKDVDPYLLRTHKIAIYNKKGQ